MALPGTEMLAVVQRVSERTETQVVLDAKATYRKVGYVAEYADYLIGEMQDCAGSLAGADDRTKRILARAGLSQDIAAIEALAEKYRDVLVELDGYDTAPALTFDYDHVRGEHFPRTQMGRV